jgi:hypothetical protein
MAQARRVIPDRFAAPVKDTLIWQPPPLAGAVDRAVARTRPRRALAPETLVDVDRLVPADRVVIVRALRRRQSLGRHPSASSPSRWVPRMDS